MSRHTECDSDGRLLPGVVRKVLTGALWWPDDEIRCLLMEGRVTPDGFDGREVEGPGYQQGGRLLTGRTVETTKDRLLLHATDVIWPHTTLTVDFALLQDLSLPGRPFLAVIKFRHRMRTRDDFLRVAWAPAHVVMSLPW